MSERSNVTIWHEEVEVGGLRKIAARGLTPNYIHHRIVVNGVRGKLLHFEHFSAGTTVILVQVTHRDSGQLLRELREYDVNHLDEIEIEY